MSKKLFIVFAMMLSAQSECMDLRQEYIHDLRSAKATDLNSLDKYSCIKSNPVIILEKFYEIFYATADRHPAISLYSMYAALAFVASTGNTSVPHINRICDLRNKLEV
jgi:hypothetical protein